jgi:hypothetical protein
MFNILNFFRSIYIYISSKIRLQKSNVTIYENISDGEDNVIDDDNEYEIFISNIHNTK